MHKISANSQKICKSAKQSAKKEISFVFRIDDYDHCKDRFELVAKEVVNMNGKGRAVQAAHF